MLKEYYNLLKLLKPQTQLIEFLLLGIKDLDLNIDILLNRSFNLNVMMILRVTRKEMYFQLLDIQDIFLKLKLKICTLIAMKNSLNKAFYIDI